MTEPTRGEYAVATTPPPEACDGTCGGCGFPFGRVIEVRWRDRMRKCLVLYGTGFRAYGIEVECPACHRVFYFKG